MRVLVAGSGGSAGWPEPGCPCASCRRKAADGGARKPSSVVVDDRVELSAAGARGAGGYRLARAGTTAWELTAPDGGRLLCAWGAAEPARGARPYDVAFLDLLGDPFRLGWLRATGAITADTVTALASADHRVPSERELARRCGFWQVRLVADGDEVSRDRSGYMGDGPGNGRVIVLGGARSGKSERAELRLAGEPDVTYVAAGKESADREWRARVAAHRARRPAWWRTVETTDLAGILGAVRNALLIDSLGGWLAAVMDECGAWADAGAARDTLARRTAGLVAAWRRTSAHVVAVSEETGLGVIPATPAGRLFRDELGRLNQALAAESEEAELVVAGRVLAL